MNLLKCGSFYLHIVKNSLSYKLILNIIDIFIENHYISRLTIIKKNLHCINSMHSFFIQQVKDEKFLSGGIHDLKFS